MLLAFAPAARAEQIIPYRGVDVRVEGVSEVKWVAPGTDHDELILIFKDTDHSKVNSVSVGADADVRVLLVGGGGAGGYGTTGTSNPGGGGGEAVELEQISKGAEIPRLFVSYGKNFVSSWIMV